MIADLEEDDDVELFDGLALADYGPAHRVCCMSCKTASLVQLTDDKPVRFCPHCGADSDAEDDEEDEFEDDDEH